MSDPLERKGLHLSKCGIWANGVGSKDAAVFGVAAGAHVPSFLFGMAMQIRVLNASTVQEVDAAFADLARDRPARAAQVTVVRPAVDAPRPDGSRSLIPAAWTDWRLKEALPISSGPPQGKSEDQPHAKQSGCPRSHRRS